VRIAAADDSPLIRAGIATLLTKIGHEIIGKYSSADELLDQINNDLPDVVLLDIRMGPTYTDEGIRAAEQLRDRRPDVGVLIISQYAEAGFVMRVLKNGASGVGYLLKDRILDIETLNDAIMRIAAGDCVIDPSLVELLMENRSSSLDLTALTDREQVVVRYMAEGYSNNGIARKLNLRPKTVEVHLANIFTKLGISSGHDVNRRVLAVLTWLRVAGRNTSK
jgi:DNA-binding NarL/FixJ family response regulator